MGAPVLELGSPLTPWVPQLGHQWHCLREGPEDHAQFQEGFLIHGDKRDWGIGQNSTDDDSHCFWRHNNALHGRGWQHTSRHTLSTLISNTMLHKSYTTVPSASTNWTGLMFPPYAAKSFPHQNQALRLEEDNVPLNALTSMQDIKKLNMPRRNFRTEENIHFTAVDTKGMVM